MFTRRDFLRTTVIGGASSLLSVNPLLAATRPKKDKLGIALVGLGYYSTDLLAPALQLTKNCELMGIVTGTPAKAETWQKKHNLKEKNIYNYQNFDQIANNPDIDVVYVVLPPSMHREFVVRAAKAGKQVFCEKPMAPSVADCEAMIKACADNKVNLAIGYRCQHDPNTQAYMKFAKEKIHSDFSLPPGKTTIQSMNYSEHAITAPFVKRGEERKLTVFPGVGYLETSNESNPDYDVNYFLLSHFSSWVDKIPNGLRDDKKEPIASFKIGMAVKSKKNSGRLIFVGDSDFLVNKFIDMQQNKELAMRTIGWLAEEDKLTGIVSGKYDDEKVKLTGTKDTVVFHLFLYLYPGAILLAGFFVVRAKRRRMSDSAGGA